MTQDLCVRTIGCLSLAISGRWRQPRKLLIFRLFRRAPNLDATAITRSPPGTPVSASGTSCAGGRNEVDDSGYARESAEGFDHGVRVNHGRKSEEIARDEAQTAVRAGSRLSSSGTAPATAGIADR